MRSCTSSGATSVRCQASVHFGFAGAGSAAAAGLVCFLVVWESLLRKTREKNDMFRRIRATAQIILVRRCDTVCLPWIFSLFFFLSSGFCFRSTTEISGGGFSKRTGLRHERPTGNAMTDQIEERRGREKKRTTTRPGRDVLQLRNRLRQNEGSPGLEPGICALNRGSAQIGRRDQE